jgi:membrane protein implicated in regulation of membrane protease activity
MLIVFGGGWGAVAALLGLALTTLLATFMLLRVGSVVAAADAYTTDTKAKRRNTRASALYVENGDTVGETDAGEPGSAADSPIIGDDGELVTSEMSKIG